MAAAKTLHYCLVKMPTGTPGVPGNWLKYRRIYNFVSFRAFLDRTWPTWLYYNVYEKEGGKFIARHNNPLAVK
jgi:hypothetical protein